MVFWFKLRSLSVRQKQNLLMQKKETGFKKYAFPKDAEFSMKQLPDVKPFFFLTFSENENNSLKV